MAAAFVAYSGAAEGAPAARGARVDQNGVLKYGIDLTGSSINTFDPTGDASPATTLMTSLVYDTLLHALPDGSYEPGLAQKVTIVDPQTIDVVLHPNMKFTDGTPVDSAAAQFNYFRMRDSETGKRNAPNFGTLLGDVEIVSPTEFRFTLTSPAATLFYDFLVRRESSIASPTAIKAGTDLTTSPVGAGPFMLTERQEGQHYAFKKNADYWNAAKIRLTGIDIVGLPEQQSRITSLRAGQIDMGQITTADVAALKSQYGIVSVSTGDTVIWGLLCKANPPLADARVRQALIYATNRDELNKGALAGLGAPMDSLFPKGHVLANTAVAKKFAFNPAKAKKLLKQAHWKPGTEITSYFLSGDIAVQKTAEILQQQWKKVGISLKLLQSQDIVGDFFTGKKQPMLLYATGSSALTKVGRIFTSDSIGNVCGFHDPELVRLATAISGAAPGLPAAVKAWKALQTRLWNLGYFVPGLFQPITWAYDKSKLGGVHLTVAEVGFPDWNTVYVKG